MKRFVKLLGGVLPVFVAFLIQGIVYIIITALYVNAIGLMVGIEMGKKGITNTVEIAKEIEARAVVSSEMNYVISLLALIVCGIIFFIWFRSITVYETRKKLRAVFTVQNISLLALLGLGCQLFISGILNVMQPYFEKLFDEYAETIEGIFSGNPYVVLFYTILVAPIVEELIFRGVMLKKLRSVIPYLGANILQAAVFGIYHWDVIQGIYAFILGLLLGYISFKFKTIVAPIVFHIIVNASAYLIMIVGDSKPMLIVMIVTGIAFIVFAGVKIVNMTLEPQSVKSEES